MLRWLKNHFNDAIIFLLMLVILLEGAFLSVNFRLIDVGNLFSLILPDSLVQQANASRYSQGLSGLSVNPLLEEAARRKAQDMASRGYFAHTSPDGKTPWHWLESVDYEYAAAGENLAVNFIDSSDVHTAWMESPGHRANIMNGNYTEIGIATATGMYKDWEAVFVVQYFGLPAQAGKPTSRVAVGPQQAQAATPIPSSIPSFARPQDPSSGVFLTAIASKPRQSTGKILLFLAGLVFLVFLITVFVRLEVPHPRVAIMPMFFIMIVLAIVAINRYLAFINTDIL